MLNQINWGVSISKLALFAMARQATCWGCR